MWCAVLGSALAAVAVSASAKPRTGELRLFIETPVSGAVIGSSEPRAFVSGRALRIPAPAEGDESSAFDVVIAIDTSASTRAPSGADIDVDGRVGRMPLAWLLPFIPDVFSLSSTDPGDSILAAEIAAARTLVLQLDPDTTRVGVVAFSGRNHDGKVDARTAVAATSQYASVGRALDELLVRGPGGLTNLAAAVRLAAQELSPELPTKQGARRIALLMTDGQPTLPLTDSPSYNAELTLAAAEAARVSGVRFDVFSIGSVGTEKPKLSQQIAAITGGSWIPVEHPADLIATFAGVSFASVSRVDVQNATTGTAADFVQLGADGTFSASVDLTVGNNVLEVTAVSTDDIEARASVRVRLAPGVASQALDARLWSRRIQMLENRLDSVRRQRELLEAELREQILRRLRQEMEAARRRGPRFEKQLEIEPEKPAASPQEPGRGGADS